MSDRNDDFGQTDALFNGQETDSEPLQEDKQDTQQEPVQAPESHESDQTMKSESDTASQQSGNTGAQPPYYGAGAQNPQWQNNQWQQTYHPTYQNGQQGYYYPPQPQYAQPQWQGAEYHQSYVNGNPQNAPGFGSQPPQPPQPPLWSKKKMKKGTKIFAWVVGALAACFVLGFSVYGIYMASSNGRSTGTQLPTSSSTTANNGVDNSASVIDPNWQGLQLEDQKALDGENALSAKAVYSKAAPSVVGVVISEKNTELINNTEVSEGSGIIITQDGYIVTNSHVVGDSKNYIVDVVLSTGDTYSGTVVGFDTKTDLAVIKIDATNLPVAELGNSDQLSVGDWVIAIGNPGGLEYANSLTRGVVSAKGRSVESSAIMKYIQTDAAINPGNSGGALLNMYGQVIGINTVKIVDDAYEGMGFAIPINDAKSVIDDLIKQGYISGRVRLGITCSEITDSQVQMYSVPRGILIREFANDSNLGSKGVQAGDIITKFNNKEVTTLNGLYAELATYKPGDTVTLTIYRAATRTAQSQTFEVTITLLEDRGETQQATASSSSSAK